MGWFTRTQQAPPASVQPLRVPLDLNAALETLLVKSMQSQAEMFERVQRLNMENMQLAAEMMVRRNSGQRRGGAKRAATARRDYRGRNFVADCELCEDPTRGDVTVSMIMKHAEHPRRIRTPKETPVAYEDRPEAVVAHIAEQDIGMGADGVAQIDCPDCPPQQREQVNG